jgi:hypothetical protein
MYTYTYKAGFLGIIFLSLLTASFVAQATVVHDDFFVELDANNTVIGGGGSGFDNGTWFEYRDPAGGPNWWNQWFFNSPDILGSKWIEWEIFPEGDPDAVMEVAINYSTVDWLDPSQPPLPDLNEFIVRESIFMGPAHGVFSNIGNPLIIPDFNPIWVSIDVRLLEPGPPDVAPLGVFVSGEIWHEHVPIPEPTTLAMMGLGLAGIGYRRHRSKIAA